MKVAKTLLMVLLPGAAAAQSIPCFKSTTYNSNYTGIPTTDQYVDVISLAGTTPVSITLPVLKNSQGAAQPLIVCPSANANYNLCYGSPSGTYCPNTWTATTTTNGGAPAFTPTCRFLDNISGTAPITVTGYGTTGTNIYLSVYKSCGS